MKFIDRARDPISFFTHFIGALLSFLLVIFMFVFSLFDDSRDVDILGATVFGLSSVALYTASSIYHYYNDKKNNNGLKIKSFLRKLDHSMIYVLIAGTYTPICIKYLVYPHSLYFILVIWIIALIGIIVKLFWLNAPRFISTAFYLLMGWALVFDFSAFANVPLGCFGLIAAGGISYTVGAIIYILKKPNWFKAFGFHELFHIFVMIGSFFHFLAIIIYVL